MIPGLGRAHLFFGSHKRGVQAAWYKVVSLVFIVFVWFYNCQLFWSNLVMNSQMIVNWYAWQTGTEISTKSRFSNGFPGRMQNSSKCRKIISFIENSSSGRKPQTIGDRTSRIVVKSRWLWFVNDIVRYTGGLLVHTPFSSPKRKMTCIHSELLAHRIPHLWNTLFGFGLFVLDTKNEKSDMYERKYVRGADWLFPFL